MVVELVGLMVKMGYLLMYKELVEMMREVDINGDGVISFYEFVFVFGRFVVDFFGLINFFL